MKIILNKIMKIKVLKQIHKIIMMIILIKIKNVNQKQAVRAALVVFLKMRKIMMKIKRKRKIIKK